MAWGLLLTIIVFIGVVGYVLGSARAKKQSASAAEKPHSRAHYHGWWVFLLAVLPTLLFMAAWSAGSYAYVDRAISERMPEQTADSAIASRSLALGMVRNLAAGLRRIEGDPAFAEVPKSFEALRPVLAERGVALASDTQDYMIPIALDLNAMQDNAALIGTVIAILLSLGGAFLGLRSVRPRGRARNNVERVITWGLLAASTIAILTTVGIVFSMLFETIHFFRSVSLSNFFFGTVWDPRFAAAGAEAQEGQFGLIPLLAGTVYIAFVAMLFAVPVGLMAAIYMAEYASKRVRSVVKPLLEVLAGIPTIVYGFFALVTVGPFLRDMSAAIAGGPGFIQAQSVLTAGLVMGIMLIPFVSSLSDDIITAVPRAMRDGSLGLGATRSETIKRVIMPAALPGIVGALLLTASRAIGETMIVVLAAGVAANLTLNPFEAMTTITVKIVNQLTGDLEFTSPQTLVAFALGMTLFVLTLGMNIFALYIVRKYREQYE
ncbi:phosphate ABC transporter permease subunit PstC [Nitratireductor rhodophyticola]|uniref:Phosphate transport system permease protein n=1 Tax=Nitratireductor rhodophyticola TaxID=2854036 RepID=A0ABS7R5H3_9HYPH|nr:phosphate ABC transporter permease subunit PstC [Nitratireductor rhodophyticola]MBY8916174.1 phosphate ABC transporter permease subunit PstC [Nitratireductor rhodophyticola]MBY8921537.1 phosphate ABC transporter permease subunit PstC [Nitratireductor rhodophyticola]MEC9247234.1 phosphate ABC transporter permease subunit PstC [Pseudomonadota bacterium]WPZ15692.1 phosphate ABC transporter permease subunit PstC [Nitratireductor rhodophyticola]